jgi:hypothetical protein
MDSVLGVVEIGRAKSTRRWFPGGGGHHRQPATANSRLFPEKRWNYQDQQGTIGAASGLFSPARTLSLGTYSVAKQSKIKTIENEDASVIHIHEETLSAASDAPAREPSTLNKSEEIRKLAKELQGRGEKPRPVTIVNLLKARGIAVSSPQVSMVLKKEGGDRRPRKVKKSAAPTRASSVSGGESFTIDQLLAAKKFVESIGSPRQAMALLAALDRIL